MEDLHGKDLDPSNEAPPPEGAGNISGSDPPTLASLLNPTDIDTDMQDSSIDVDDDTQTDPEHGPMPDETNMPMDPALDDPQSECVPRLALPDLRLDMTRRTLTQDQ